MNIALFTYDMPHKKTNDFLNLMNLYGYLPKVIIANPIRIKKFSEHNNVSERIAGLKASAADKYQHLYVTPTRKVCELLEIPYVILDHNSEACEAVLKGFNIHLGIVGGARLLKKYIIDAIKMRKNPESGILNFHPGLIPENRGLGCARRAKENGIKQGVTVHYIDERMDMGYILERHELETADDDSLKDINMRLHDLQCNALIPAIMRAESMNYFNVKLKIGRK